MRLLFFSRQSPLLLWLDFASTVPMFQQRCNSDSVKYVLPLMLRLFVCASVSPDWCKRSPVTYIDLVWFNTFVTSGLMYCSVQSWFPWSWRQIGRRLCAVQLSVETREITKKNRFPWQNRLVFSVEEDKVVFHSQNHIIVEWEVQTFCHTA